MPAVKSDAGVRFVGYDVDQVAVPFVYFFQNIPEPLKALRRINDACRIVGEQVMMARVLAVIAFSMASISSWNVSRFVQTSTGTPPWLSM